MGIPLLTGDELTIRLLLKYAARETQDANDDKQIVYTLKYSVAHMLVPKTRAKERFFFVPKISSRSSVSNRN